MFLYLLIFILSFFIRWISSRNLTVDFDSYGHLYYINQLSNFRSTPWSKIKIQCWNQEYFHHPFFLHWILSYLPQKFLFKYQRAVNITLDSFFVLLLFIVSNRIFDSIEIGFLSIMIYTFTPIFFTKTSMGPRLNNFTPRLFTEILFNILSFVLLGFFSLNSFEYFICLFLLILSILLTSKFGVQVLFFIIPIYSLITFDFYPVLAILLSLIFLLIISRGDVWLQLKRQIIHSYEYFIYNKSFSNPNRNKNKFIFPKLSHFKNINNLKNFLRNYLFYNSHTIVILKFPIFILLVSLFLLSFINPNINYNFNNSSLLILSAFLVYIITSSKKFLYLGEAERYLSHICAVIIIISLETLISNDLLIIANIIILYGFIIWLAELLLYRKFTKIENRTKSDSEIESLLNKIKDPKIVLSPAYHNFNVYRIMLNTKHFAVFPYHMTEKVRNNFKNMFEYQYPFLDLKKLNEMIKLTNSSIIIIDNDSFPKEILSSVKLPNNWYKKKLNSNVYTIYIKD
tara:strand:- start:15371 stop:16909 length:1539 start_codon:yes stop_codon:yes gene_type:complete